MPGNTLESRTLLLVESGSQGFGILSSVQGILNTANVWNESGIKVPQTSDIKYLKSGIHSSESRIQGFVHPISLHGAKDVQTANMR